MPSLEKPSSPNDEVRYFSAADLAQRYRVHKITIFKWVATGYLPPGELIGPNTRRWRSNLLEKFERARRQAQSKKD